MNFLKKIFDHEYKQLENFNEKAKKVLELEEEYSKLSDKDLKNKTEEFKERLKNGETLEDILTEAFATVREAAFRVNNEKPYFVQVVGGLAIHYGNIAEMRTGEGKTLTSTLPAYLNALTGNGVHIITVNEYLASRDAEWMGNIYRFLGLTVGVNYRDLSPNDKKNVYNCDIMYSTNSEIGFDYLRDNMVVNKNDRCQRPFNYVIIDEVDSVLIDEARTPLIISGGQMNGSDLYVKTDNFIKKLKENDGYIFDEKTKAVTLDKVGTEKAQKYFSINNLYDIDNTNLVHHINVALRANYSMKKDFDYVVQNDEVVIVDQFTGRLMNGRQFSDGLHQALEAKENVTINAESKTLATITFQNLFRMYKKLSGMTGTAKTEEEEFREIYNMYVITIPTNREIQRIDYGDLIFATSKGKFNAIVKEIKERNSKGQPVLVGTVAVETSELISSILKKQKIKHEVLNAKNHEKESELIMNAGQKGAVTIATNMAGRGADIKLGEGVKELGGLAVLGTERHESRRIDNQLRGRSGRQGDPGFSQFYVSFEDELMVRYGTDRAKGLLQSLGFNDDMAIRHKMLSSSIEQAQKRIEGNNYDYRKDLLDYDDVINQQRDQIYKKRNQILDSESIRNVVIESIDNFIYDLVMIHADSNGKITTEYKTEILEQINENILKNKISIEDIDNMNPDELVSYLIKAITTHIESRTQDLPDEIINAFEKAISLRVLDTLWMEHINTMSLLREGIHLRGIANENPLRAYTNEGFQLFENLLINIDKDITIYISNAEVKKNTESKQIVKPIENNDSNKNRKSKPATSSKTGRNEKCPCGSGKKYKQCCGK